MFAALVAKISEIRTASEQWRADGRVS
jgi:hypothetical protein